MIRYQNTTFHKFAQMSTANAVECSDKQVIGMEISPVY